VLSEGFPIRDVVKDFLVAVRVVVVVVALIFELWMDVEWRVMSDRIGGDGRNSSAS
jgi:hypothetical protein